MIKTLYLVVALVTMLALPLFVSAQVGGARVTAIDGDVHVGDFVNTKVGDDVIVGTAFRTANGTITFSLQSGISFELYPNTSAQYLSDDGAGRVNIVLNRGTVAVRRKGNNLETSRFSVMTPQVVAFLYGTTTSSAVISLPDNSHTKLFVTEGRANLRGLQSDQNANGVSLPAGNMTQVDEKVQASDPAPFTESDLPSKTFATQSPVSFSWWVFGIVAILGIATGRWVAKRRASR